MDEEEFDIEKVEKINFEDWENEFKEKHPIKRWINDIFGGNLFGYAPWYSLSHPQLLFMDFMREIKWAYQRVVRGWDDKVVWSVDFWLDDIMPDILLRLKETKQGIPSSCFDGVDWDKNGGCTDEEISIALTKWNNEIDSMIRGFQASKALHDGKYDYNDPTARVKLQETVDIGLKSFVKHYGDLWD